MKPYPSYKDSGVEWIGKIPSHWDVVKTYILSRNLDGKRVPLNSEQRGAMEGDIPYWGSNGVVDYVNDFIFDEQIVLVGEDGSPFFDKNKPVSFYVDKKVWVNNHIHILKPNYRITPKYFTHSFNVVEYKEYITGSTRDKLTQSDLSRIPHCVPPLAEQHQIVSFLDKRTGQIDELIEKKKKKIELLKEHRTTLINHVVTKGLNPDVEMKDSGVEWIGEIPSHWSVFPLKHVSEVLPSNVDKHIFPDEIPVKLCNYTDVYYNDFINKELELNNGSCNENEYKKFHLQAGDVIITKDSETPDDIGIPTLVVEDLRDVVCGYHLTLLRPHRVNGAYLFRFIQSDRTRCYFEVNSSGITRYSLGKSSIESLSIPVPPLSEQQIIADYLNDQTGIMNEEIRLEEKKIELLKEFRTSLISDVVTGKVCVLEEV